MIREMPVEGEKPQTRIEIADPVAMLGIVQRPEMQDLATEAKTRLQRVIAEIASA
jgi:hypothetical protein